MSVAFKNRFVHNLLSFIGLVSLTLFAIWWFNPIHFAHNFYGLGHIFDVLLFGLLTYIIWHPLLMQVLSWSIASHIPKKVAPPVPEENLRVAFLTTFVPQSESITLLERSLPRMVNVDYQHDTWVLDEGNDPEVIELCKRLGVKHHSRFGQETYNAADGKYARKTKGGNHNSWYDLHGKEYDIVAQIDTDFIASRHFLTRTLGYFRDPKVAFVGTPQIYGNTNNSIIARGAAQQTYSFYGPILRGLYGMDMTLLIGANHVVRVKALEGVDHYSAHITEDLLTGMKLHAGGWTSKYVPEMLAMGEGPTSWQAFFDQQMRWAYGCMDILFRHSPKLFKQMKSRQRLYYYFLQQHYFSGLAMMLGIIGLGLYAFFGLSAASLDLRMFLVLYGFALIIAGLMALTMQRFNVRPKKERGLYWSGMIVNIAAWPIFFMAFIGAVRGKRLTYKVTPKGTKATKGKLVSFSTFRTHMWMALFCVISLGFAYAHHRRSIIMLGWMIVTASLLLALPFVLLVHKIGVAIKYAIKKSTTFVASLYRFYEIKNVDKSWLPGKVSEQEKYKYVTRSHQIFMIFSCISFTAISISVFRFLYSGGIMLLPLWIYYFLTLVYFLVTISINFKTKNFDIKTHMSLVSEWKPEKYPSIDIFLPVAGESLNVLRNTWEGVEEMVGPYKGQVQVYCLDDSDSSSVSQLAEEFGFNYHVRPNRGWFKKAGNLRHGFEISNGEFIVIFDADFRPRKDFLEELLPYFYKDSRMGIVQSPQYFDVHSDQGWLERGAGAVQELFYRFAQVSRETYDASICVGSNAIYRRLALNDTGGTALIEHSEDVHTGFNIRAQGWKLTYVPIILAKGLCPANMNAFFKQQYRWCLGSMSLLSSEKFWKTKLKFRARLSYISGFLYYIHTAISSFFVPVLPIILLLFYTSQLSMVNYLLVLPSLLFMHVVLPLWHDSTYGMEAWAVRMIYGWAHFSAVTDVLKGKAMSWNPTGSRMKPDKRYINFRILQIIFNFIPSVFWVGLSVWKMFTIDSPARIIPILLGGLYFLFISSKVAFYTEKNNELNDYKLSNVPAADFAREAE